MNFIIKSTMVFLAASSIASVAMASPGDNAYGSAMLNQANLTQLTAQIKRDGASVKSNVVINASDSISVKSQLLSDKVQDLQRQINSLQNEH